MPNVFISHASPDKALADSFVRLLEGGVGLSPKQIFCASLEGQGIPPGEDFKAFIAKQLLDTEVVIALISENFYASAFCMCELGATWIQAKRFVPILVPPLGFSDLRAVLEGVQCLKLDSGADLDVLRDTLLFLVKESPGTPRWNKRRSDFLVELNTVLPQLPKPRVARREEFEKLLREKDEYVREYAKLDSEVARLKETVRQLSELKDREKAAEVILQTLPEQQKFEQLLETVKSAIDHLPWAVKEALYYWIREESYFPESEDRNPAQNAVEEGLLVLEVSGFSINEGHPKLRKAMAALQSLGDFVSQCSEDFTRQYELKYEDILDVKTRTFWKRHLR